MRTGLISPHFTWGESVISPTAQRLGLDNSLPVELEPNVIYTAQQMERVRALLGEPWRVSSWFRSPKVNAAVGGSKTSAHMKAMAVDGKPRWLPLEAAFDRIAVSNIPFDQLIHEGTADGANWIHIGFTMGQPRREVLRAWGQTLGGDMTFSRIATG